MRLATLTLFTTLSIMSNAKAGAIYSENFNSSVFRGSPVITVGGNNNPASATSDRWAATNYYGVNSANGWTFTGGALYATNDGTTDGAILLNETGGGGAASKTISGLTAGKSYTVEFLQWGDNRPGQSYIGNVSADGNTLLTYFGTDDTPGSNPGTARSFRFTATGTSVTLDFGQASQSSASPIIDELRVSEAAPQLYVTIDKIGDGIIKATLRDKNGIPISDDAKSLGFDHFNWRSVITKAEVLSLDTDKFVPLTEASCDENSFSDCNRLKDSTGRFPTIPADDPPLGGWAYQAFPHTQPTFPFSSVRDDKPWYWDEGGSCPYSVQCHLSQNGLEFVDGPAADAGFHYEFLTSVVGILDPDGALGVPVTSVPDLFFRWTYDGTDDATDLRFSYLEGDDVFYGGTTAFRGFASEGDLTDQEYLTFFGSPRLAAVPEPGTLLMFASVLLWLSCVLRGAKGQRTTPA